MSSPFRVIIAVPSLGQWAASFGVSLVNLMSTFTSRGIPGYSSISARVLHVQSSVLPKNRFDAVQRAREFRATHLMFLDSDQTFPPDTIHRLASHHKLVVGANSVTKSIPAHPVCRVKSEEPHGAFLYTDPDSTGVVPCWRIATGVLLINMSVFDKIGDGVWDMKYLPERHTYQGEDWTFSEHCENAGIPLWVDQDLSKEIGHIGSLEFTHDLVGSLGNGV